MPLESRQSYRGRFHDEAHRNHLMSVTKSSFLNGSLVKLLKEGGQSVGKYFIL